MPTVVIVGRKNVGKSTIFNRLIGMRLSVVYKEPGITRDRVYGEVEWCGTTFNIIDTGGFFPDEEHTLAGQISKQIDMGVREADLIYLVVDGKEGLTPADESICQHVRKSGKLPILIVLKWHQSQASVLAVSSIRPSSSCRMSVERNEKIR